MESKDERGIFFCLPEHKCEKIKGKHGIKASLIRRTILMYQPSDAYCTKELFFRGVIYYTTCRTNKA